jgi:hypothetical protein
MSTFFAHSDHMPCTDCGASVAAGQREKHVCDPQRQLDFRMFQARDEVASFDRLLAAYLDSSAGRFAQWLAEHERPTS